MSIAIAGAALSFVCVSRIARPHRIDREHTPCYKALSNFRRADIHARRVPVNRKGGHVNKSELIDQIAKQADISKAAAGRALDATVGAVTTAMKKGGMVTLVGFGTFYVGKRSARSGRNPRTGAMIKIRAAKVPKFRAGKALKDAVN
jgi:DNA-binding protein HU-beta